MNTYMVDIILPEEPGEEFILLIPRQRIFINRMIKQGKIVNYSLSIDRNRLWVVITANSAFDVKNIIGSFPIFNYIRFTIHNLLFHEMNTMTVHNMSLN